MEEINVAQILKNAIASSSDSTNKTQHILSGISANEVLVLADESKVLKIYTHENDVVNLNLANKEIETSGEWKQVSSNNEESFATYSSIIDDEIKILVDETKVEDLA